MTSQPAPLGAARPWRTFVAVGDSFSEGLMDDLGPDGRHIGWADRVAAELAARQSGFAYANLAIRGRLLSEVIAEQVPTAAALHADLVSLAAGLNDVLRRSYDVDVAAQQLEAGVRALREAGSDVLVFAWGDPSRRSRTMGRIRDRVEAFDQATVDIAAAHGCYLVSFWGLAAFDDDRFWAADRLHLSPEGHARVADAVLEALGLGDGRWRTPPAGSRRPSFAARRVSDARWAGEHLGPWLLRRLRGVSSGDGVTPKRPELAPVPARSAGE